MMSWPAAAIVVLVAGCAAVGPDYVEPALAVPDRWAGETARAPRDPELARWWRTFSDEVLTGLIDDALAASTTVRTATARLREARARRVLAGAQLFPIVRAEGSASRIGTSGESGRAGRDTSELYSMGFDASWEADVFGGLRRGVEAAQADFESAQATLDATRVSLTAEVAVNYIELRAFQARLVIARNNLASQSETVQLTEWRALAGLASSLDVEQARTNREQTRAVIPPFETGAAEAQHRIAILTGRAPGALAARLSTAAPVPGAPESVGLGIPAETLRQRPDVRAAERKLAAETARSGQAIAARYPSFALSGSIGLEALTLGALGGNALAHSLVASIGTVLFDAGRLRAQVDVQSAIQEQALVSYEAAVLGALEEVENALVALQGARGRSAALRDAVEAARNAALLARDQYASGLIDFQTLLNTDRSVLAVEDALASSEADSASALVQLYKALGGGWTRSDATR